MSKLNSVRFPQAGLFVGGAGCNIEESIIKLNEQSAARRRPFPLAEPGMRACAANIDINPPEIHAVLNRMLASDQFVRSQRMSRLLRFVVEKAVQGDTRQLSEYAIGIEVFDRNAATYNPGEDPIVRVQVGRLREKLHQYYANQPDEAGIRLEIPLGTYVPTIKRVAAEEKSAENHRKIMLLPLSGIAAGPASAEFARGLREELLHQLYLDLGSVMVPPRNEGASRAAEFAVEPGAVPAEVSYLLEGSVRHEADRVRVSMHLVDAHSGFLVWSQQFDGAVAGGIAAQESLAREISVAIKDRLDLLPK